MRPPQSSIDTSFRLVLTMIAGLTATSPPTATAQFCGQNSPAQPVPECRNRFTGAEIGCGQTNAVRLWTDQLRPGRPGQTLPPTRDSTQWATTSTPGAATGLELFNSVDIVGDDLYVSYNAGLQAWKIDGPRAEDPARVFTRDGWRGDFLSFPESGKNDFYIYDVDAIAAGKDRLIGLAGVDTAGMSLWQHSASPPALDQIYQDLDNDSRQVRLVELGDTIYAFAGGVFGLDVYDVDQARKLTSPCLDESGSVCPGVYRGKVGDVSLAYYIDLLTRDGALWLAVSGGPNVPVELWAVPDPAAPVTAEQRFSGLPGGTQGVALFEKDGTPYMAVTEQTGVDWWLRIYDVTSCLDADGCASLGAPVWSRELPAVLVLRFLTYSESNGRPFLYFGNESFEIGGPKIELLLDLEHFPDQVVEVTDGGGTYTDACNGQQIDYWGDYYPSNDHGLDNVRPRVGRFDGRYFYRAAWGLLDVHVYTAPPPPPPSLDIFSDDFESGDLSAWSGGS